MSKAENNSLVSKCFDWLREGTQHFQAQYNIFKGTPKASSNRHRPSLAQRNLSSALYTNTEQTTPTTSGDTVGSYCEAGGGARRRVRRLPYESVCIFAVYSYTIMSNH